MKAHLSSPLAALSTEGRATKIQKLVLFTGFSCNLHCHFCIDLNKRDLPDKSTQELIKEMALARRQGVEYLEIIGGEATIRGDFHVLLLTAKKLDFKYVVVVTNGRMLAYPEFAKKTIEAGVHDLVFSIHGHDAKLHDELVFAQGAFDDLLKGVSNVRALGHKRVFANCTVVKRNMRPGSITSPAWDSSAMDIPVAWKSARNTVP